MGSSLIMIHPYLLLFLQNSSQKLKDVAKYMNFKASKSENLYKGTYTLSMSDDKVSSLYCLLAGNQQHYIFIILITEKHVLFADRSSCSVPRDTPYCLKDSFKVLQSLKICG